MPLEPRTRKMIDILEKILPRPGAASGPELRARMHELVVSAGGDKEPVHAVEDRTIPGPAGEIPVRIYRPSAATGLPVLVYFHGGGWVICDLETHDPTCRAISNGADCVVVSVDYRLAPEHKFPAAADDAYAATAWVAAHASELGADASRVAVGGDSAGGNLTAAVALMARDRGGPPLAFQVLVYPVLDLASESASRKENGEGYFLTSAGMTWYEEQYLRDDADRKNVLASPLLAGDLTGLPPALVVTAEYDPLRDEGEAYGRRLTEAGVPATVSRYDGMFHGFLAFAGVLDGATRAQAEVFSALRTAFGA